MDLGHPAEIAPPRRPIILHRQQLLSALRKVTGNQSIGFRPGQFEAICTVISTARPLVLAVLPTGGGKTSLWMVPAIQSQENGHCIVLVVPLVAVQDDALRRCQRARLRAAVWHPEAPSAGITVFITTHEASSSSRFPDWVNKVRFNGLLDLIIIDEVHVIFDGRFDFRACLLGQGRFLAYGTPLLMLSATLPPSQEASLRHRLGFVSSDDLEVIRTPTVRPNLAYSVKRIRSSADHLTQLVQEAQLLFAPLEKGIMLIYAARIELVEDLARALTCPCYHAQVERQQRQGILARLLLPGKHVLVTTNALGLGLDLPDVHTVLHVTNPHSLVQYMQESGRAGRHGEYATAVLLDVVDASGRRQSRPPPSDPDALVDFRAMETYLEAGSAPQSVPTAPLPCRRAILAQYFDGTEILQGCQVCEVFCDLCQRRESSHVNDDKLRLRVLHAHQVLRTQEEDQIHAKYRAIAEKEIAAMHIKQDLHRDSQLNELKNIAEATRRKPSPQPASLTEAPESSLAAPSSSRLHPREAWESQKRVAAESAQVVKFDAQARQDRVRQAAQRQQEIDERLANVQQARLIGQVNDQTEFARVHRSLQELQPYCMLCLVCRRRREHHSAYDCSESTCDGARELSRKLAAAYKAQRPYKGKGTACFLCHAPQAFCPKFRGSTSAGFQFLGMSGPPCLYRDTILPLVAALIFQHADFRSLIIQQIQPASQSLELTWEKIEDSSYRQFWNTMGTKYHFDHSAQRHEASHLVYVWKLGLAYLP